MLLTLQHWKEAPAATAMAAAAAMAAGAVSTQLLQPVRQASQTLRQELRQQ
jgi:hypothetical protein